MNILSQLTKARFALKRKFDDLKQVKNHTNLQLEKTFTFLKYPRVFSYHSFTSAILSDQATPPQHFGQVEAGLQNLLIFLSWC